MDELPATNSYILGMSPIICDYHLLSTEAIFNQLGNNTGNIAFTSALIKHTGISGKRTVPWGIVPSESTYLNSTAIIPCANQLGSHVDMGGLAESVVQISSHIAAIGLGAQSNLDMDLPAVPEGTVNWLKAIASKSASDKPNISLRGPFTKKVLDSLGLGDHGVALGCPSLFLNPDSSLGSRIKANIKKPERIAVTGGHYKWKHLSSLENSLVKLVTKSNGAYITQSPVEMIHLARGEAHLLSPEVINELRLYMYKELSTEEFLLWARTYCHTFFDFSSWFDFYKNFDFVIGTRIHGVMIGIQCGIPSICIPHDSRTLELCVQCKIPYLSVREVIATGIDWEKVLSLPNFSPEEFDCNRNEIATNYYNFAKDNRISVDFTNLLHL